MSLRATVEVELGALDLRLTLEGAPGSVIAVLGPNGAGKTTVLRALAGLHPLTGGRIEVDGRLWSDAQVCLPPQQRRTGWLSAEHLLFPHLTALDNVAFGPRSRGATRAAARTRASAELAHLDALDLAGRLPGELSHGQAQRVALARAFATDPDLLLLDEPLAALDPRTRIAVRSTIDARLRDYQGVTVLVTHDPLDALTLADTLVFLDNGRVVQQGSPRAIVQHPRDPYVAQVAGLNLYRGTRSDTTSDSYRLPDGATIVAGHATVDSGSTSSGSGSASGSSAGSGASTGNHWISFAPSAVALYPARPEGSPRNTWPLTVAAVELTGQVARVHLTGSLDVVADITLASVADLRVRPGDHLWASVKATEVRAYPA